MSKKTANTLFMLPPLAAKYGRFYQDLLRGIGSYQQLGNKLIQLAEQAHAFRQFDKVKEIGQLLSNIPIKSCQAIGYYFLAVAANSKGNGDQEEARRLYELAADMAPTTYKAKAILSLAAVSANMHDRDLEMYYYLETIKAGKLSVAGLEALRGIAIYKAIEGYHDKAVKDLEGIYPFIKYAPPHIYYDYLNSLAVELGTLNRRAEARVIMRPVLASPFAPAYPEWQGTANELKEPNHSLVTVSAAQNEHNVVDETQQPPTDRAPEPPAKLYLFPNCKEDSPQLSTPEPVTTGELDKMSRHELKARLLSIVCDKETTKNDYKRMLMASKLFQQEEGPKQIDLESDSNLEQIVTHWMNESTTAEEFVALFSALRDCEGELRRVNIIDRMISLAYRESSTGFESESEWRKRFEAKLTPNPYASD